MANATFAFVWFGLSYAAAMRPPQPLRRRVRNQICLAVGIALVLFAVPLGVAIDQLLTSRALTGLQRDATRAVALVPDTPLQLGSQLSAPPGHGSVKIALYTPAGQLVSGSGPVRSALAAATADGREHHGGEADALAVALPIISDGRAVGSVRAAESNGSLRGPVLVAWALLAALALLVLAVAALLARVAAARLAKPFEAITGTALDLADGRTPVPPSITGIAEADMASAALYDSSMQISELLRSERDFVAHASHQLRTPLSALLLHLQREPADVPAALERVDHLEATITDLLTLRSRRPDRHCNPGIVARQVVARRRASDAIDLRVDETPDVAASGATVRQCLDILLDNALRHGAPPVTLTVEAYGDLVALEVADHGPGMPESAPHGTGLALAAQLADRAGGRLLIRQWAPHPRIAILLPAWTDLPTG